MHLNSQDRVFQRIGEFVVCFQWIEHKLREIGWHILGRDCPSWPPMGLRKLTNEALINEVHVLFRDALRKCNLPAEMESEFIESFSSCVENLHELRKVRNRILHSAFVELKAGGEVRALLRSSPRLTLDEDTGEYQFDREALRPDSFDVEMRKMAETTFFLNKAHAQLVQRYPKAA